MKALLRAVLPALQFLLLMSTVAASAASRPPAEVFGALPHVSEVALSPGGNALAWVQIDAGTAQVMMYDIAAPQVKRVVPIGADAKARHLLWLDDNTLLMEVSVTFEMHDATNYRAEYFRWIAVDMGGGPMRQLLKGDNSFPYVSGAEILSARSAKPKTVYLKTWNESATDFWRWTLYEVDSSTGKGIIVERGSRYTKDWVLDRNGRVAVRQEWNPDRKESRLVAVDGTKSREFLKETDGEQLDLFGLSTDAKAVVARGRLGGNRSKAWSIPLDGSPPSVLAEDPERDVASIMYDSSTGTVLAAQLSGAESPTLWLDKGMESRFASAARPFPGKRIDSYDESRDHSRAVVRLVSPSSGPVSYIVEFAKHSATVVGEEYPALAGVTLGEMTQIAYTARDGTSIPAFQTLPPASSGKNLPLIVLPHGGPNEHDRYEFDWLVQFLATRGYAVLQPQFRGSSGYGHAYERAGDRQWGGLMQDDISDGVKALVERGIADPHRVCAVGMDYGGYAALVGAELTPGLYACAVSIGGITDLPGFLAYIENRQDEDGVAYWKQRIGSPHDPLVIARSPARAVGAVRAPILLMHGVDDTTVPMVQAELMNRELQRYDKRSEFIKLPNEDHWLSRTETRVRVLKELDTFLAANLKAARDQ
jgi:dipeptidyl aminopeptidase/acylaminoacyl peptidase